MLSGARHSRGGANPVAFVFELVGLCCCLSPLTLTLSRLRERGCSSLRRGRAPVFAGATVLDVAVGFCSFPFKGKAGMGMGFLQFV